MQFIDGAVETWTLGYDDFRFIAEQQKPTQFDIDIKLLSYRAFGRFYPLQRDRRKNSLLCW